MTGCAYIGADIFDGQRLQQGRALLLQGEIFHGVVDRADIPADYRVETLAGGVLMPGFVDLQVNGGGGVMFNDVPTVAGLRAIAMAHATTGTRALLPTLITDTPEKTQAAVTAVEAAIAQDVPGIIGVHLEGPHLSVARKGAHDAALIRPMTDADEAFLVDAAARLPNVMVTVAPENVSNAQIGRLAHAGVIVSLGHSDCGLAEAEAAIAAGARCVTHLFNAMSQLGNREPGLVGAALQSGAVSAGLIADAIHVHPATMNAAIAAKRAPGHVFLVTDAMSTVGSDITEFHLNGRRVLRKDNRLTLEDGTLAGADLDLPEAIAVLTDQVGIAADMAYAMATSYPAALLREAGHYGAFKPGAPWHGIHLDGDRQYRELAA